MVWKSMQELQLHPISGLTQLMICRYDAVCCMTKQRPEQPVFRLQLGIRRERQGEERTVESQQWVGG